MFKKPIFLYIATFVLAIAFAFFSSYFIVRETCKAFGIGVLAQTEIDVGSDINMQGKRIVGLGGGSGSVDATNLGQFEAITSICLPCGGTLGNTCDPRCCVDEWCDLNDFDFCTSDDFYPWGDDPPCFTAETQVLMADGKYKNIADVQSGEYVLTRESENSAKLVKAKVLNVYEHWYDGHLVIINGSLEVTPNHAMFVNGEWKQVRDIELGDKLLNKDNQEVVAVVESMEKRIKEKRFKVYNLEIEKYHTYFAGGFYVHNFLKAE